MSIEEVNRAHTRRLSTVDRLIPEATAPEVEPGEEVLRGESGG